MSTGYPTNVNDNPSNQQGPGSNQQQPQPINYGTLSSDQTANPQVSYQIDGYQPVNHQAVLSQQGVSYQPIDNQQGVYYQQSGYPQGTSQQSVYQRNGYQPVDRDPPTGSYPVYEGVHPHGAEYRTFPGYQITENQKRLLLGLAIACFVLVLLIWIFH